MRNEIPVLLVAIFAITSLLAIDDQNKCSSTTIQVTTLKGILITDKNCCSASEAGVQSEGVDVPKDLKKSLKKYLKQPVSQELISAIQSTIVAYYQKSGSYVYVSIPDQDITNGYLNVVVQKARIGKIIWDGQEHCKSADLEKHFVLQSGDLISQEILLNDLNWLNRNPFRHTEAIFRPGEEAGTVDLEMKTEDRRTFRFYTGADNTGNRYTDYIRIYGGLNWGNAFGRGDIFTYQYTLAPNINRFQAHFGQYVSFLPWKNILTLFGGFAQSHPHHLQNDFHSLGKSAQASLRYTIPIARICCPFKEELTLGADWKYTNTNIFFIDFFDFPVAVKSANLFEWMATYAFSSQRESSDITFNLEGHFSPGSWLTNQTDKAYKILRPGAKVTYFYGDFLFGYDRSFKSRWSLAALVRGQISTAALLPMQEFSLGGYNSVRGYLEHDYLADDALCFNFEIRVPSISIQKKNHHELTFLAFVDGGCGHDIKKEDGLRRNEYLVGVGPGLRYHIGNYLAARADFGFQLHSIPGVDHRLGVFHVGAQLSY